MELVFSDGSREVRGWVPHVAAVALARELAVPVILEARRSAVGTRGSRAGVEQHRAQRAASHWSNSVATIRSS
jgi:hypothetical protein